MELWSSMCSRVFDERCNQERSTSISIDFHGVHLTRDLCGLDRSSQFIPCSKSN